MSEELKVYALDDGANKHQSMTKEQIITAITQAINDGTITNIDAGFITKLQEKNHNKALQLWIGTSAEFQALESKNEDTLYMLTDDTTVDDLANAITALETNLNEKIETEIKDEETARKQADSTLTDTINTNYNTLNSKITTLSNDFNSKLKNRKFLKIQIEEDMLQMLEIIVEDVGTPIYTFMGSDKFAAYTVNQIAEHIYKGNLRVVSAIGILGLMDKQWNSIAYVEAGFEDSEIIGITNYNLTGYSPKRTEVHTFFSSTIALVMKYDLYK